VVFSAGRGFWQADRAKEWSGTVHCHLPTCCLIRTSFDADQGACLNRLWTRVALQEEMLASSQAKVVELHNALSQHAHKAGVSDQQLIVDNARMSSELESSMHYCQECEG